jgi:hypothetical protein
MPEEDLILGDPAQAGAEEEGEVVFDETTPVEYIESAMNVLSQLDSIDTAIMTQASAKRIKQMKYWAIYIAWSNMKDIYEMLTDQEED